MNTTISRLTADDLRQIADFVDNPTEVEGGYIMNYRDINEGGGTTYKSIKQIASELCSQDRDRIEGRG